MMSFGTFYSMWALVPVEARAMEIAAVYVLRPHVMVLPVSLVVGLPIVVFPIGLVRLPVVVLPVGLVVLPLVVPVMPPSMLMMLRMLVMVIMPGVLVMVVMMLGMPVAVVMPGVLVMAVMMLGMLAVMVMPAVMALAIIIIPVVATVLFMLMVPPMLMPFIGIPLTMAVIPFTGVTAVIALPVPVPAVLGHRGQRQREHRAPKYYRNHSQSRQAILLDRIAWLS